MKLVFCYTFSKNPQVSNLIKIHPLGAMLLHADGWMDGQIDMMKLTVAFCNFVNASKMDC